MNQLMIQKFKHQDNAKISKKDIVVGLLVILILVFALSFEISAKQLDYVAAKQIQNNTDVVADMQPNTKQLKNSIAVFADTGSRTNTNMADIGSKSISNTKQASQRVNKQAQTVNQETQTNKATTIVNKDAQQIVAEQLRASFKQTTFTNLGPAPIAGWYQAELSNQVIYFSPKQELMFLGEVYTKNGVSLSQQTRNKWQTKRIAKLDISDALVIGNGVIEVIEFSDTDCGFCQRFNRWITTINNTYQAQHGKDLFTRKVILTPIDQLHPNAHKEAVHILCQSAKDYEQAITQSLESKIAFADMDSCQRGKDLLVKHREIAQEFGVSATPTLVIAGQIIQGFNKQKLQAIIKQQLNNNNNNNNKGE